MSELGASSLWSLFVWMTQHLHVFTCAPNQWQWLIRWQAASLLLLVHSGKCSSLRPIPELQLNSHVCSKYIKGRTLMKMSQKLYFLLLLSGALTSASQACRYLRAGTLINLITFGEVWTKYTHVTAIIYFMTNNVLQWQQCPMKTHSFQHIQTVCRSGQPARGRTVLCHFFWQVPGGWDYNLISSFKCFHFVTFIKS